MIPMRLLLSLAGLAGFALCVLAMWWGWRGRARRQAAVLAAFPPLPADFGPALLHLPGVYVSSTFAGNWQDRIVVGDIGFRSNAQLWHYAEGVLFRREGASPLWIPAEMVTGARFDRGIAGKVMGTSSVLVLRWKLGEHELDTGFLPYDDGVDPGWRDSFIADVVAVTDKQEVAGDA